MGGKKVAIVVVLVAIIVAALAFTLRKQLGTEGPPAWVMEQKAPYICGKCGHEATLMLKEWLGLSEDKETGYRKCPKCGEMKLGALMTCMQCGAKIVSPPREKTPPTPEGAPPPEPVEPKYICPKCGKNAFQPKEGVPPGAPPPPAGK